MELVDKKLQLLEDFSDSISILKSHINPVSLESPLDRLLKIEALKYSLSSLMTLKTDELIIFMMLNYENCKLSDVRKLILKTSGHSLPNYQIRKIESFVKRKLKRNLTYANV